MRIVARGGLVDFGDRRAVVTVLGLGSLDRGLVANRVERMTLIAGPMRALPLPWCTISVEDDTEPEAVLSICVNLGRQILPSIADALIASQVLLWLRPLSRMIG